MIYFWLGLIAVTAASVGFIGGLRVSGWMLNHRATKTKLRDLLCQKCLGRTTEYMHKLGFTNWDPSKEEGE